MKKRALESPKIDTRELRQLVADFLLEQELRQHSPDTLNTHRIFPGKLLWYAERQEYTSVGTRELKQFVHYLAHGHEEPEGRWGNPRYKKPLRPASIRDYFNTLSIMFNFAVEEDFLEASPMQGVPKPRLREEVKQPLNTEQVQKLLKAASQFRNRKRNEAIVLLLLDTGVRASELCGLKVGDIDLHHRCFKVRGKGNKMRQVFLGRAATRALISYLRRRNATPDEYLFLSDSAPGGREAGEPMTRNGIRLLINRLAKTAGIEQQCSPHTLRRTFAVEFLRGGGNVFSVQQLLGHEDLKMTRKYCSIAQADIESQHRMFSPADRLKR